VSLSKHKPLTISETNPTTNQIRTTVDHVANGFTNNVVVRYACTGDPIPGLEEDHFYDIKESLADSFQLESHGTTSVVSISDPFPSGTHTLTEVMAPSLTFAGDPGTGIESSADRTLEIVCGSHLSTRFTDKEVVFAGEYIGESSGFGADQPALGSSDRAFPRTIIRTNQGDDEADYGPLVDIWGKNDTGLCVRHTGWVERPLQRLWAVNREEADCFIEYMKAGDSTNNNEDDTSTANWGAVGSCWHMGILGDQYDTDSTWPTHTGGSSFGATPIVDHGENRFSLVNMGANIQTDSNNGTGGWTCSGTKMEVHGDLYISGTIYSKDSASSSDTSKKIYDMTGTGANIVWGGKSSGTYTNTIEIGEPGVGSVAWPSANIFGNVTNRGVNMFWECQKTSTTGRVTMKMVHDTTTMYTANIVMPNLPDNASGLATGTLYNDSGTLKIA